MVTSPAPGVESLAKSLQPSYSIAVGGTVEESKKSQASALAVVPLMLLIMVTVLMFELKSFSRLFLALTVAPLGLIGVVGALLLSGRPLGFVAILGILALIGIITKNAVILIGQIDSGERARKGRGGSCDRCKQRPSPPYCLDRYLHCARPDSHRANGVLGPNGRLDHGWAASRNPAHSNIPAYRLCGLVRKRQQATIRNPRSRGKNGRGVSRLSGQSERNDLTPGKRAPDVHVNQYRDYNLLFTAFALALLGTGIAVVGIVLLAFDLASDDAWGGPGNGARDQDRYLCRGCPDRCGSLRHRAEASPHAHPCSGRSFDDFLVLPLITSVWQLYALIFVFAAGSAVFNPTYQALVPYFLPEPSAYYRALTKARVANELESAASPLAAAVLLLVLDHDGLFVAAMAIFLLAAAILSKVEISYCGHCKEGQAF